MLIKQHNYSKVSLHTIFRRKKVKIEDWVKSVGIKSYTQLEMFCRSIGAEPPSKESCLSLFVVEIPFIPKKDVKLPDPVQIEQPKIVHDVAATVNEDFSKNLTLSVFEDEIIQEDSIDDTKKTLKKKKYS